MLLSVTGPEIGTLVLNNGFLSQVLCLLEVQKLLGGSQLSRCLAEVPEPMKWSCAA